MSDDRGEKPRHAIRHGVVGARDVTRTNVNVVFGCRGVERTEKSEESRGSCGLSVDNRNTGSVVNEKDY